MPAHQGVLLEYLCSLRYAFQPHNNLCVPAEFAISKFIERILCSRSGSPDGTTPPILVPSPPPPLRGYGHGKRLHHLY